MIKLFPHEVHHIEGCMLLLQLQNTKDFANWETRYMLMLWLCILCIIPFDICTMDSSMSSITMSDGSVVFAGGSDTKGSSLVHQIVGVCMRFLCESGPTRDAASACLSTLLTRPDMESDVLNTFIEAATAILEAWSRKTDEMMADLTSSTFELVGTLHCLSQIFKKGHRKHVLPHTNTILAPCLAIANLNNQTLTRKLLTKLFQRIGLTYLPPRVASWRYQRGSRSLIGNLSGYGSTASAIPGANVDASAAAEESESEVAVPDELEDIVDQLLIALQDKDTVVRWSGAKGIGRVTMLLPHAFADDVIGAVLEVFGDPSDDCAWHGGCLALAELSRRGLLLPDRLVEVMPIVSRAMQFDVLRGQHSVGAHVRDAACYVCWAFARAYSPLIMRPFVSELKNAMIVVALFDRDINCRRAASAAFQENVGRQGNENFPLGIEITTIADYFTLGIRTNAYVEIAPSIAALSHELFVMIVDHLVSVKLSHWDEEIRNLSATALGKLTSISPVYMSASLLRILPTALTSPMLPLRHGAVLFASHVALNLSLSGNVPPELAETICDIVPTLDKARMFRGRGSEVLRASSCALIESIARAQLSMVSKTQVVLLEFLNENLKYPHEKVQRAAANALRQFLFYYLMATFGSGPFDKLQKMTVLKYMEGLKLAENAAFVRGYALAVGVLPFHIISHPATLLGDILERLGTIASPNSLVSGEPDAESRRNAVEAVVELGERVALHIFRSGGVLKSEESALYDCARKCLDILLRSCEDYSVDKRGDTGSWSRMLAVKGIERLIYAYTRADIAFPHNREHAKYSTRTVVASSRTASDPLDAGMHIWSSYGHAVITRVHTESGVVAVTFPPESLGACELGSSISGGEVLLKSKKLVVVGMPLSGPISGEEVLCAIEERIEESVMETGSQSSQAIRASVTSDSFMDSFTKILLRLMAEKLDAVRIVAGTVLMRLLQSKDPFVHNIPDRHILIGGLVVNQKVTSPTASGDGVVLNANWGQPNFVFPYLTAVLRSQTYFHAIISGFVVSVGGLTEAIVKQSSNAMMAWCQQCKRDGNVRMLHLLGTSILRVFDEFKKNDRVIVPLIKTIQLLFKRGVFEPIFESSTFQIDLFARIKAEMVKCGDTKKIRGCVDVICFLVNANDPLRTNSLRALVTLLGHPFPQIRRYAAEQLYLLLIADAHAVGPALDASAPAEPSAATGLLDARCGFVASQNDINVLSSKLTETAWELDVTTGRQARAEVAALMGLDLALKSKTADASKAAVADELDSYESLVREAGY